MSTSSAALLNHTNHNSSTKRRGRRRARPSSALLPGKQRPAVTDGLPILGRLDVPLVIDMAHRIHATHAKSSLDVPLGEAVTIAIQLQFPGEQMTEVAMVEAYKVVVETMFPGQCQKPKSSPQS